MAVSSPTWPPPLDAGSARDEDQATDPDVVQFDEPPVDRGIPERRRSVDLAGLGLVPKSVAGSLCDRLALPLRDGDEDVEHHTAGGRPRVDRVGHREQ